MRSLITTFFARLLTPPDRVREDTDREEQRPETDRLRDFVLVVSTVSSTDDGSYVSAREALKSDLDAVVADADRILSARESHYSLRCAVAMALGATESERAVAPLLTAATADLPLHLGTETASSELSVATTAVDALADLARSGVEAARGALGEAASAETSLTTTGLCLAHLSDLGATELYEQALGQLPPAKRYLGSLRRIDVEELPLELDPYLVDTPHDVSSGPPTLGVSASDHYRPSRATPILPRASKKPRKDRDDG